MRCMLPASETEIQLPRMPEPDRREFGAVYSRKAPEAIRMFVTWSLHRPAPSSPTGRRLSKTELAAAGPPGSERVKAQTPPREVRR
jgi:hypothetical protein